jgi:hypothetical protein
LCLATPFPLRTSIYASSSAPCCTASRCVCFPSKPGILLYAHCLSFSLMIVACLTSCFRPFLMASLHRYLPVCLSLSQMACCAPRCIQSLFITFFSINSRPRNAPHDDAWRCTCHLCLNAYGSSLLIFRAHLNSTLVISPPHAGIVPFGGRYLTSYLASIRITRICTVRWISPLSVLHDFWPYVAILVVVLIEKTLSLRIKGAGGDCFSSSSFPLSNRGRS